MIPAKAIGIDLGTTNSAVAWIDEDGHTAMVPNAEGDLLTPSVVLFDDKEVVVGKAARTATVLNPERVAVWVKRDMGAPVYNRPIRGEYLPPEVIQACILRKLRSDVVQVLGPECRCVITVPAYFDEPRRKATADAGEMAGLEILDIVNEPTAGALAFGETLGYLSPVSAPKDEMTVMVYDLGGGTFDVTLLRLGPGNVQTLATDGDVQLGGYDWDLRVVEHVAESFKRAHGVDPRENPSTVGRLFMAAMESKHSLSARSQTIIRLDYQGRTLDVPLSRPQFEELTADLLERTAYTTRQVLAATKLQWKDVNRVLLVGGSTRMPAVPRMLQELTGITPDHTVNPDEAVARGAAIYASYLINKQLGGKRRPSFEVTNVNSHSLGIEGIDHQTLRKKNVILIPRNTPLPAKIKQRFATKNDAQRSIVVQVLEGESSLPGDCTAIGRTVIRDLPPTLTKGSPVEVTFEYGANGRLSVHAVVPGVQREVKLDMERAVGLSTEGVARWKQAVSGQKGFDAFESMLLEVLGVAGGGAVPLATGPVAAARPAAAVPPLAAAPLVVPPTPHPVANQPAAATVPLPAQPAFPVTVPNMSAMAAPARLEQTIDYQPAPARLEQTIDYQPAPVFPPVPLAGVTQPFPLPSPAAPGGYPLPTTHHPLPTTHYPLPMDMPPLPPAALPPAALPMTGGLNIMNPPAPHGLDASTGMVAGGAAVDSFDLQAAREDRKRAVPRGLISLVGYITSAVVGLGAGYLLLHWLQPERFPWP